MKAGAYNYLPHCTKCGERSDTWLERGAIVKMLLFWLPLKKYDCRKCKREFYLLRRSPFE